MFGFTKAINPGTKRQLLRFLVVGCSAVATDFSSYFVLLNLLNHAPAKAISFILGTIVAYIFNKYWTFNQPIHSGTEMIRFATLYASTLATNVAVNHIALQLAPSLVLLAFLVATSISTILNFFGQKCWVFRINKNF
jgi:putative flippase GtrA